MTGTTRTRKVLFPLLAALGVCVLAAAGALAYTALRPPAAPSRPLVLVHSPGQGEEVAVGEDVLFQAVARSEDPIVRAELWIDGTLEATQASPLAGGITPLLMMAKWRPPTAGPHTLTARAFDARGARSHTSITVQAVESPDRDRDGVLDADDACPDEAGVAANRGCPEAGAEPAEPSESAAPQAPVEADGDGDGVADHFDLCPSEAGAPANAGCPESGAPDSDGDGVADDVDLAPAERGRPEDGGSPPPDADSDGDGLADEEEAPAPLEGFPGLILQAFQLVLPPPPPPEGTLVEFQTLGVHAHQRYDAVTCYACLGNGATERVELERVDELAWQVPGDLGLAGGQLQVATGQPVTLTVQCNAYRALASGTLGDTPDGTFGDAGGDQTYYDLGSFTASHAPEEWDGRQLMAFSENADADAPGRIFHMNYRICEGSCEEAPLPAPSAGLFHYLDGMYLQWIWNGDPEQIDRFFVWCYDGSMPVATRSVGRDERRVYIGDLAPCCDKTLHFEVQARRDSDYMSSPPSNLVAWEGEACPGSMRIEFTMLPTFGWGTYTCGRGPIYGGFYANDEHLWFVGADEGYFSTEEGYFWPTIPPGGGACPIHVDELFGIIRRWQESSLSSEYEAPLAAVVYVPMRWGEDLTVGFGIWDFNLGDHDDVPLAFGRGVLPASHLVSEDFRNEYGELWAGWDLPANGIAYDPDWGWYRLSGDHSGLYFDADWLYIPTAP